MANNSNLSKEELLNLSNITKTPIRQFGGYQKRNGDYQIVRDNLLGETDDNRRILTQEGWSSDGSIMLDDISKIADMYSAQNGVPMTGLRAIDKQTGKPLPLQMVKAIEQAGLKHVLSYASVPKPQAPSTFQASAQTNQLPQAPSTFQAPAQTNQLPQEAAAQVAMTGLRAIDKQTGKPLPLEMVEAIERAGLKHVLSYASVPKPQQPLTFQAPAQANQLPQEAYTKAYMTGLRAIDPQTGEPMSQQAIEAAYITPQAPSSTPAATAQLPDAPPVNAAQVNPAQANQFSQEAAAQVNPMLAPQFSQEAAAQVNPMLAPQIDQTFDQAPQAPSIFQPQQTQIMPSETIGQYPAQANQFSQEAAAQVNPMLAPQIDQTFDQAPQNANVSFDFSGQPTPQAPSIFQSQQTQLMPSKTIGQYPMQANQFSQEAAAQVNPMLAPQNANVSFDFSGQPTPQAPAISDAEKLERYRQRRLENPLVPPTKAPQRSSSIPVYGFNSMETPNFTVPDVITPSAPTQGDNSRPFFSPARIDDFLKNMAKPGEWREAQRASAASIPVVNPFNDELMVNSEQFLTAEEAQAKAEKGKYAGMTYDQMQMAMAMERTQLEDNSQTASTASPTASTASPTALTQPNSFATSQGAFATVGGTPISEFLSGKALPERGLMRAENPMYGDNSLSRGLGGDAATQAFQDAYAAREARIEQGFGNGRAVSNRERRNTGEMSMEAAVRMAGGDIYKARQMIELQRQGRDPVTGKVLEATSLSLKEEAEIKKINAETAKILDDINKTNSTSSWTAGQIQAMKTQAQELSKWEVSQLPTLKNNLATLRKVEKSLADGQIKTGGFGDQIPGLSNWARPWLNPDAEVVQQEVNGVVMQTLKEVFPGAISDGEREALISTVYNPKLSPDKNAELVGGYADRLNKAMNAKKQQVDYFRKNGSLEGYNGATPRDALLEGINIGSGSSGSPIEGDVDIQSESDQYYKI